MQLEAPELLYFPAGHAEQAAWLALGADLPAGQDWHTHASARSIIALALLGNTNI